MSILDQWEAQADLLEPHHEYKEAEPSRSGKTGVRCVLCGHYTNGMERGNCSPCPEHASYRIKSLIQSYRKQREVIHKKDDALRLSIGLSCCCGELDVYKNPIKKCVWCEALELTKELDD